MPSSEAEGGSGELGRLSQRHSAAGYALTRGEGNGLAVAARAHADDASALVDRDVEGVALVVDGGGSHFTSQAPSTAPSWPCSVTRTTSSAGRPRRSRIRAAASGASSRFPPSSSASSWVGEGDRVRGHVEAAFELAQQARERRRVADVASVGGCRSVGDHPDACAHQCAWNTSSPGRYASMRPSAVPSHAASRPSARSALRTMRPISASSSSSPAPEANEIGSTP